MTKNISTLRLITISGLFAGVLGMGLAKAAGMAMPLVPPGAVLLVAGACLVAFLPDHRWPALVAALVALAEVVPSAFTLAGVDGAGQAVGTAIRLAGALVALVMGVTLAFAMRKRGRPVAPRS
ncbi:hypothetical protein [Qaidamihabitans albus]|uniref:hypothetical protein n=1 Tax=Qaidamihabitans albus TaxID=2795733 RepID=UPI0018F1CC84|nr:hypothetical protein [Qaidamihabitans albus]